jgi:flagellar motor switch/type III secretory pathway protein FliN
MWDMILPVALWGHFLRQGPVPAPVPVVDHPSVPEATPFPWDQLRPAAWSESALAAWLAAGQVSWPDAGILGAVRWVRTVSDRADIARRLGDPANVRLALRHRGALAAVITPWPLWRAIARRILGEDAELAAPRPPTPVERAFVAVAVADGLGRAGVDATVELSEDVSRPPPGAVAIELTVTAPVAAELMIVVPHLPPPPRRPLADLIRSRGDRLPTVTTDLELARGRIGRDALAELRRHDVLMVGPATPILRVGAGAVHVALDRGGRGLIVQTPYRRAAAMIDDASPDPESLGHDLIVPLTVVVAELSVSARQLLELIPGQVLATGRPVGTTVEVRAAARTIARGELVTVDGVLGVRVTEVVGATSDELVGAAPPMIVPASR